jgi:crotonobetainyl-CoA:carnitine CoA-transferase CaiB-like acyl-CoA transferase
LLGIPYKLSKTPAQVRTAPPILGQHTDEILRSLGYTQEDVELARQERAT